MEKLTQAGRLKIIFDEFLRIPSSEDYSNTYSMQVLQVKNDNLDVLWEAAKNCLSEIEKIYSDSPQFRESTRVAMSHPIGRLNKALSKEATLDTFQTYRSRYLTSQLTEDLDHLDASLEDKEFFETFSNDDIVKISEQINELKNFILNSSIDDGLKKTFHTLLNRMQQIFDQYDLYGDQELQQIADIWAGKMLKHHEALSKDINFGKKVFGLLNSLWKNFAWAADTIARLQTFTNLLPK